LRLLLDTHALVWWVLKLRELSPTAFDAIKSGKNSVLVSAATAYEIEYKRDRDRVLAEFPSQLEHYVESIGFKWLPITPQHMVTAARLSMRHRDPWDRILAAQSLSDNLPLVSLDEKMTGFGVTLIW